MSIHTLTGVTRWWDEADGVWRYVAMGPRGLPGADGSDGTDGTDGASAYDIAVANGFVGTQVEWLASLNGNDGTDGTDGTDGSDGASAYEVAVANGFVGTEAEWLDSLVGPAGTGGSGWTRTTNLYAATALAAGATDTGSLPMGASYRIYKVQFNFMGRLRIYTDAAKLAADAARPIGTDPSANSGLMLEYVATAAGTYVLSPVVDGFTDDGVDVHLALTNTDVVARNTTITLTYVRTE